MPDAATDEAELSQRFQARIDDPLRQWKLSVTDLPSRQKWYEYSRARDMMLKATDTKKAPWHILRSDNNSGAHASIRAKRPPNATGLRVESIHGSVLTAHVEPTSGDSGL